MNYAALIRDVGRLESSPDRAKPVVLPTYNGARRRPNLTALLALLPRRYGIPVLVHGLVGAVNAALVAGSESVMADAPDPVRRGRVTTANARGSCTSSRPYCWPMRRHASTAVSSTLRPPPCWCHTDLKDSVLSVIDLTTWKPVAAIATNGRGFFLRSHEATPYAWVHAMNGPKKNTLQIIDKRTLEVVRAVTPPTGTSH